MTYSANDRPVRLIVNGLEHRLEVAYDAPLLAVLRNDLAFNGPKYGCGLGECGACTVLIEGKAARACVLPVGSIEGLRIVTLEGLEAADGYAPIQAAVIAESATQCGYCLNGMIMTLAAYLKVTPHAQEADLAQALRYNLCRCGSHLEVMRAALRAAHAQAKGT